MVKVIRCVCLVEETEDKILLVQVRHREKYYFPGGKIEAHESMLDAIQREVNEELKLDIPQTQFEYIGTVVGQAYPQKNMQTELNGYRVTTDIDWEQIQIDNEITDIKWVDKTDTHLIAPAVQTWIAQISLK